MRLGRKCCQPGVQLDVRKRAVARLLWPVNFTLWFADAKRDEYSREHAQDRVLTLQELRAPAFLGHHAHTLWSHQSRLRACHRELFLLRQRTRWRRMIGRRTRVPI